MTPTDAAHLVRFGTIVRAHGDSVHRHGLYHVL